MLKSVREMGLTTIPVLAPGAMERLLDYHWPGNVREVQNMVERALILSKGEPLVFHGLGEPAQPMIMRNPPADEGENDGMPLSEAVSKHIVRALETTGGRVGGAKGAAQLLRVNPSTLRKKMRKLGISFGRKTGKQER